MSVLILKTLYEIHRKNLKVILFIVGATYGQYEGLGF